MGICLILGGSKPLPGWFGALMQWKLKFNWAFSFVKKGFKACQDSLWQLFTPKMVIWQSCSNWPRKKCPRVPVWVRGGRCKSYSGNAQMPAAWIWVGLPWVGHAVCSLWSQTYFKLGSLIKTLYSRECWQMNNQSWGKGHTLPYCKAGLNKVL